MTNLSHPPPPDADAATYDVAIVGGGIHGAGIAQAAAAAGYRSLLIERHDWGSGTSSKSSKLIHGGLRYLQSAQWSLVRESLRERELLLTLAPELVQRRDFYIPLYQHSPLPGWQLRTGLWLYQILAGFHRRTGGQHRSAQLGAVHADRFAPLKRDGLSAIFRYSDAQTDDSALTRAVVQSAELLGAETRSNTELHAAIQNDDGYRLELESGQYREHCRSRMLINACGPWVNHLIRHITPAPRRLEVDLVQGTHIHYRQQLSPHCFYLQAPQDGRAVFVLPWQGGTLVGTTETLFLEHPDRCQPLAAEIDYLQQVVRHYFPSWQAHPHHSFAGLRVLPKGEQNLFRRSREVQLLRDNRYLAVYGGKLTGYRATALKVIEQIAQRIGKRVQVADTAELPLKPFGSTPLSSFRTSDRNAP